MNAKVQFAQARPWLLYTWMLASFPLHFAHMALSDLRKYKERQRGAL
jgi:hypothetical protein